MKRGLIKTTLLLLPFIAFGKDLPKNNNLEKNISGSYLIETVTEDHPSFPKATFYNDKDTIIYFGDFMGRIKYNLPAGEYNVKIEPGKDTKLGQEGEKFLPYNTKVEVKGKSLERITPDYSNLAEE